MNLSSLTHNELECYAYATLLPEAIAALRIHNYTEIEDHPDYDSTVEEAHDAGYESAQDNMPDNDDFVSWDRLNNAASNAAQTAITVLSEFEDKPELLEAAADLQRVLDHDV